MKMFTAELKSNAAVVQEIEAVIKDYFQGYLQAEAETLLKAFDPRSRLLSVDENKVDITEMSQWLDNLRHRREKGDTRTAAVAVIGIDVTGDAAVAKTTLTFAAFKFTDYLSLLRFEGGWKIVNKIYTTEKI